MPAAFDHNFAKRLNGTHIKNAATRWDMVEQLREDIPHFQGKQQLRPYRRVVGCKY